MSLCASRLLPGAGGGSPARRGAWGERGKSPLHPLHPRTPLFAGTRNLSLESGCTPSAACRAGRRREPSRPFRPGDVRACCGAPSALRAFGIAFAPATRCISGKGRKERPCRAAVKAENWQTGELLFLHSLRAGRAVPPPRVSPFSKLKRSKMPRNTTRKTDRHGPRGTRFLHILRGLCYGVTSHKDASQRFIFLNKARWGRDRGPEGKGNTSRASRGVSLPPGNIPISATCGYCCGYLPDGTWQRSGPPE